MNNILQFFLIGYAANSVTQQHTIHQLFHLKCSVIPLEFTGEIPNEIIANRKALIIVLHDPCLHPQLFRILGNIYRIPRHERCGICWIPFDRYTGILFTIMQQNNMLGGVTSRVLFSKPERYLEGYYYYNPNHSTWICEPSSLPLDPSQCVLVNKSLQCLPFDYVVCQSDKMRQDFEAGGKVCISLNYPSSSMGAHYSREERLKLSSMPYVLYDGSTTLSELAGDNSFQAILADINRSNGFVRIKNWKNPSLSAFSKINALMGFRRGALPFYSRLTKFTYEQRWGGGTKLNVAARAKVPLIGYWQDSYESFSKGYPFIEYGTNEFDKYLQSATYRQTILAQSSALAHHILVNATPLGWANAVISFFCEVVKKELTLT